MHFSSFTVFLPAVAFMATSVAAFALPAPQFSENCQQCMSLYTTAEGCGLDMTSSSSSMSADGMQSVACICAISGFQKQYADCMSCSVSAGYLDASTAAQLTTAVDQACSTLSGESSNSGSSLTYPSATATGSSSTSTSSSSSGSGSSTSSSSDSGSGSGSSNGNTILSTGGAGSLSIGSGQMMLGALVVAGMGFYAL